MEDAQVKRLFDRANKHAEGQTCVSECAAVVQKVSP